MHNFFENLKLNILFLVINAICIYFKIQHFHGVKENRGISGYNHQIERCLL